MREIKSAVITGPTGAIGTAMCGLLVKNGVRVYAVCRPDSKRLCNIPNGAEIIECDLSALNLLKDKITSPIDVFFHFGWQGTTGESRNNMLLQNENIKFTLDAAHAADSLGCKVFITSGSQAEYGRVNGTITPSTPCFPENGYGMAKLCAGQMCRIECEKLGMDFIWTRILSVYGPFDGNATMIISVIKQLLNGDKPALTSGEQMWDYIYADDAARAFYLLAQKGISGKTYVVAGGKSQPLKEYVKTLRDCINPALPLGFGEVDIKNPVALRADTSDLKKDTGFEPQMSFEKGIKKTIEYVKSTL
ncbi:MAG: NAD(P)-dependent oxidoreductase [Clostridia bacterium]|nr:NAD(P)-dependent oxidoreductase [Clostridia bacterium]